MMILRPCESAIRRLIIIAAHGLVLKARISRPLPVGGIQITATNAGRAPAFPLIEPLKTFSPEFWNAPSTPVLFTYVTPYDLALAYQQAQALDEPVSASALFNRLRAMRVALNDLPRQARRLARWRAASDIARKANLSTRLSPYRPGLPPRLSP